MNLRLIFRIYKSLQVCNVISIHPNQKVILLCFCRVKEPCSTWFKRNPHLKQFAASSVMYIATQFVSMKRSRFNDYIVPPGSSQKILHYKLSHRAATNVAVTKKEYFHLFFSDEKM